MKNRTGFNNKSNHSSNILNLKSILSLFTMGIFIFFGFASIEEGAPELQTVDCEFFPPIEVVQNITFRTYDENRKTPIGLIVSFLISEYDKSDDNGLCSLVLKKSYNKTVTIDSPVDVSFTLDKIYVSNDDEIEIYYETFLKGYNGLSRTIRINRYKPSIDFTINIRKIDQYP